MIIRWPQKQQLLNIPHYFLFLCYAEELQCAEECERVKQYVATEWPDGVVKYHRTDRRSGLIRARIEGAKVATGDVMIFLDSHCEASEGW